MWMWLPCASTDYVYHNTEKWELFSTSKVGLCSSHFLGSGHISWVLVLTFQIFQHSSQTIKQQFSYRFKKLWCDSSFASDSDVTCRYSEAPRWKASIWVMTMLGNMSLFTGSRKSTFKFQSVKLLTFLITRSIPSSDSTFTLASIFTNWIWRPSSLFLTSMPTSVRKIWIYCSCGLTKGATLTLARQRGTFLIVFLAIYVEAAGVNRLKIGKIPHRNHQTDSITSIKHSWETQCYVFMPLISCFACYWYGGSRLNEQRRDFLPLPVGSWNLVGFFDSWYVGSLWFLMTSCWLTSWYGSVTSNYRSK